jgi:hypothetical protein
MLVFFIIVGGVALLLFVLMTALLPKNQTYEFEVSKRKRRRGTS